MNNEQRVLIAKTAISMALGVGIETFKHKVVGSTYISDSETTDVDIIILDESASYGRIGFDGWEYGGSCDGVSSDHWESWKRTVTGVEVNMIIVTSKAYFDLWIAAAEACRFLHLQGYQIRKATVHGIHEIVMDGGTAEVENLVRTY